MISYNSNNFEVVINMTQVAIALSPPAPEWGRGDCSINATKERK